MKSIQLDSKKVAVQIDDTKFNSIKEAAAFLEIPTLVLGKTLNNNMDEHVIKGFKVKRLSKFSPHAHGYVYCKRTGKLYTSAAELANVTSDKSWTINTALKSGSYVDRFKNSWIRISKEEAADIIKNQEINNNIPQPKVDINVPTLIKANPDNINTAVTKVTTYSADLDDQCSKIENNVQDLLSTLIHRGRYTEAHKALDALANFKNIFDEIE